MIEIIQASGLFRIEPSLVSGWYDKSMLQKPGMTTVISSCEHHHRAPVKSEIALGETITMERRPVSMLMFAIDFRKNGGHDKDDRKQRVAAEKIKAVEARLFNL